VDVLGKWRSLDEFTRLINRNPQDTLITSAPQVQRPWLLFDGHLSELPFGVAVLVKLGKKEHVIRKLTNGTYEVM
jgi:hypothetical protein